VSAGLRDLRGRTALVTGAASGIGRATALALARAGADLVLADVDAGGLAGTAGEARALGRTVAAHTVDVADRRAMAALADAVHAERAAVDVLVNNAGVGLGGLFTETPLEDWDWVVGVNFWGVVHGCHFFVPPMMARGAGGHVVNVASAAGLLASPELAAYSTTKFAVVGLSEALREELRPHGIGVTTVCPGLVNTPITRTARVRGAAAEPGARERLVALYERRGRTPEYVAAAILDAIRRDRGLLPVTPEAWLGWWAKRISPRFMAWIGRRMRARLERELRPG
jgi:NAD(P)-dependent dehydrogenase (short-subunit alcohol dehydrogenase family)